MQSCIGRGRSVESVLFVLQARIWGVKMRLAVVSSDGKNVDLHLGKGHTIYISDSNPKSRLTMRDLNLSWMKVLLMRF